MSAEHRFFAGGNLICTGFEDAPSEYVFSIDCDSWAIAKNFRGMKMIPPGFHLVTFGKDADATIKTCFAIHVSEREAIVLKYSKVTEDIDFVQTAEPVRIEQVLEVEKSMAPYPQSSYKRWLSLTGFVSSTMTKRIVPTCKFTSYSSCEFEFEGSKERDINVEGRKSRVVRSLILF